MNKDYPINIPFLIGSGFLLLIVLIEFLTIVHLNNGLLVYTLDDPYIHLSLARHIMKGHYGINNIECSAPSSSILWPFLIAPFSSNIYFPFIFNIITSVATVYIFSQILNASFEAGNNHVKNLFISLLLILLILATNLIGLIYTGMEHPLQVLIVSIIAYGLIIEYNNNKVTLWLLIAITLAPLIRYENLAVSLAAIVYLLLNKYIKKASAVLLLLLILMGGFSLFLLLMNLDPLPTSIMIKSYFVESGGSFHSLLSNFAATLRNRQGIILVIGALILFLYMLKVNNPGKKKLAFTCLLALGMHFIAGRYDWFNRYEIYVWTFFLLIIIFFAGSNFTRIPNIEYRRLLQNMILISAAVILVFMSWVYITGLFDIPLASNNIYEQQYQMHRFVLEFYKKPVAVNDLGYVSYGNDYYVLDLFGLASIESLNDRIKETNVAWMQEMTEKKHVGLVMIYCDWFPDIPFSWIKIGTLNLGKRQITPARSRVTFYATNKTEYPEIVNKLHRFSNTLPVDVIFQFETNSKIPEIN